MLASLLPGLRDLRAPLAAGYLWLAAGWLYFAPKLPVSIDDTQGVLRDIYRVVQASGPIVVGAGLTFAAYMVGILSTGLLTPLTRLILLIPFVPLAIVLIPLVSLWIFIEEKRPSVGIRIEEAAESIWRRFSRLYALPVSRAEGLVMRMISTNILTEPAYCKEVMDHLQEEQVPHYMRRVGRWLSYEDLMKDPSDASQKLIRIQEALSKSIQAGGRKAAEVLVKLTVDIDRHARDVLDELKLVPERIVGDRPATYERWDRLSAEGEFRVAVVPPLAAIIAILVSRGVLNRLSGLLLVVPVLVILLQGMSKAREAQGQLLQTLEAGIIDAVPIQRLASTDLHWFSDVRGGGPEDPVGTA